MAQLDISSQEASVLRDVLDSYISDLRMEIADTDSMNFRDQLKEKKSVLIEFKSKIDPVAFGS